MTNALSSLAIYQTENGALHLREDTEHETFWASQKQIAQIFEVDVRTINEHLKNIFTEEELEKKSTIRKFRIVQKEGNREVFREIEHYNLDAILSVGYRVNSKKATQFRKWATQTLKQHITKGYTINTSLFEKNKKLFFQALEDIKTLGAGVSELKPEHIVDLVQAFALSWFSLQRYDEQKFPTSGSTKTTVELTVQDLWNGLHHLKSELVAKKEATHLFAEEKTIGNLEGIFGNVMQSVFGEELYPSLEEKAAHLLYFIIKNHPFNDGNKRSGAFSFIWFLQKSGYAFAKIISPATLTTLTILIAESDPKEKEKMIGFVLLLLNMGE